MCLSAALKSNLRPLNAYLRPLNAYLRPLKSTSQNHNICFSFFDKTVVLFLCLFVSVGRPVESRFRVCLAAGQACVRALLCCRTVVSVALFCVCRCCLCKLSCNAVTLLSVLVCGSILFRLLSPFGQRAKHRKHTTAMRVATSNSGAMAHGQNLQPTRVANPCGAERLGISDGQGLLQATLLT